jgi:tetratricopeptide (TPR) repeat protein
MQPTREQPQTRRAPVAPLSRERAALEAHLAPTEPVRYPGAPPPPLMAADAAPEGRARAWLGNWRLWALICLVLLMAAPLNGPPLLVRVASSGMQQLQSAAAPTALPTAERMIVPSPTPLPTQSPQELVRAQLFERAAVAYNEGSFRTAAQLLGMIVEAEPTYRFPDGREAKPLLRDSLINAGLQEVSLYASGGRVDLLASAIAAFTQALELEPGHPIAEPQLKVATAMLKGEEALKNKNLRDAIARFTEAYNVDRNFGNGLAKEKLAATLVQFADQVRGQEARASKELALNLYDQARKLRPESQMTQEADRKWKELNAALRATPTPAPPATPTSGASASIALAPVVDRIVPGVPPIPPFPANTRWHLGGKVQRRDGAPFVGLQLHLVQDDGRTYTTAVDQAGNYDFIDVTLGLAPQRTYTLLSAEPQKAHFAPIVKQITQVPASYNIDLREP